jgi:hypothetical protein
VEYQQIGAWRHVPAASTNGVPLEGPGSGTLAGVDCRVVFGTLLGPETTGPGFPRDLCFWFPGCIEHARLVLPPFGWVGWCVGCVVRGCCLRTT